MAKTSENYTTLRVGDRYNWVGGQSWRHYAVVDRIRGNRMDFTEVFKDGDRRSCKDLPNDYLTDRSYYVLDETWRFNQLIDEYFQGR